MANIASAKQMAVVASIAGVVRKLTGPDYELKYETFRMAEQTVVNYTVALVSGPSFDRAACYRRSGWMRDPRWRQQSLPRIDIMFSCASAGIRTLLDDSADRLSYDPDSATRVVHSLAAHLRHEKTKRRPGEWNQIIQDARSHRILGLLHQDPLSRRAFEQPRGYQGDAELLDMIYSKAFYGVAPTALGRRIFSYTITCKAPEAVRQRMDLLADYIDQMCAANLNAEILSVACGHLREGLRSRAVMEDRLRRLVGLDQDPLSIAELRRSFANRRVEGVCGSIKALFGGALARRRFDFIYSAGLYDYLPDEVACRLTARLLDMLQPGGRLLIANYLPDIEDVGYMECYMGWRLIYRTEHQMADLVPVSRRRDVRLRSIADNTVALLEIG